MKARYWALALGPTALALAGPLLSSGDPSLSQGMPYGTTGLLGTDRLGRDVLARLLDGGAALVFAPILAVVICEFLSLLVAVTVHWWPRTGRLIRHLLDVLLVIPGLLVMLCVVTATGMGTGPVVLVVVLMSVPFSSRYLAAAAAPIQRAGYVENAVVAGDSRLLVLVRDIAPVLLRPILADAGLRYLGAVYLVASVAFLGMGPGNTWADAVVDNMAGLSLNPWASLAPALAIALLTVPVALVAQQAGEKRMVGIR